MPMVPRVFHGFPDRIILAVPGTTLLLPVAPGWRFRFGGNGWILLNENGTLAETH